MNNRLLNKQDRGDEWKFYIQEIIRPMFHFLNHYRSCTLGFWLFPCFLDIKGEPYRIDWRRLSRRRRFGYLHLLKTRSKCSIFDPNEECILYRQGIWD